jgi:hypothetical protein
MSWAGHVFLPRQVIQNLTDSQSPLINQGFLATEKSRFLPLKPHGTPPGILMMAAIINIFNNSLTTNLMID